MAESILVTGKKISSMELVTNVTGNEKIPTGQPDDLALTPNQIADHTIARGDLASQEDLSQVEVSLGTQITDLAGDVTSTNNSIRGLIAAEEAARIAADNLKVDKEGSVSSVAGRVGDVVLAPSDVLVEGFGSQEDVNKYVPKPFLSGYTYGLGERVVLDDGEVVKSLIDGNVGNPNVDMTGWVSIVSTSLSDTIQTFTTPEAGVDPVTGVADGAYFNVQSSSDESYVDEYQNIGGVPTPTGKSYPSSAALNNIPHNNLKDRDEVGAHPASAISYGTGSLDNFLDSLNDIVSGVGTPFMYGAIADGTSHPLSERFSTLADAQAIYPFATSLTDEIDWAACQALCNSNAYELKFTKGSGDYVLNRDLIRDKDVAVTGQGTLNFSSGNGQFLITGAIERIANITNNPARLSKQLTWAANPGLSPADIVVLWNPTNFSFGGRRAEYRDGGMFRVHSMSGNTANTYDPVMDDYVGANFQVYKLKGIRAVVADISLVPARSVEKAPLALRHCVDSVIQRSKSTTGGIYGGLMVDRCYAVSFVDATPINNSDFVNNEYGIIISNSTHVSVRGNAAFATRHSVTLGGSNQEASVPNRFVTIYGMSLQNHSGSENPAAAAADIHGNSDYVTYNNCHMFAASGGGRNIALRNCTLYSDKAWVLNFPETNGGYLAIDDCVIQCAGDGVIGIIYVQPHGSGGYSYPAGTWMRDDLDILINGLTVYAPNATDLSKVLSVRASNINKKVNVSMRNVTVKSPMLMTFLFADDNILTELPSDYLIVDDVSCTAAGAYLIYPTSDIVNIKRREMAQSGYQDITTTESNIIPAQVQNFRYKYSKRPSVSTSVSASSGGSLGLIGGAVPIHGLHLLTPTSVSCVLMAASGNFTAGATARVHWRASVDEV